METIFKFIILPVIFIPLFVLVILAFKLPKTKLSKYLKMNQAIFLTTYISGIICCALGLAVILIFPSHTLKLHLWEIIISPYVYMQLYTGYVAIAKKTSDIYDEKIEFDMASAGGVTMGLMIPVMALISNLFLKKSMLEIDLLFPFYLNTVILIFSTFTVIRYKLA